MKTASETRPFFCVYSMGRVTMRVSQLSTGRKVGLEWTIHEPIPEGGPPATTPRPQSADYHQCRGGDMVEVALPCNACYGRNKIGGIRETGWVKDQIWV